MDLPQLDLDPYANDPGRWGNSLVTVGQLILGCLDIARPRYIAEVGAYAGDVTQLLLEWAGRNGSRVVTIDPSPEPGLEKLAQERSDLDLVRETSHDALTQIDPPGAVVIDGDHNYYTVLREMELVEQRAGAGPLPLMLFHDLCWPHGRRDNYFAPELVPEEYRQPIAEGAGLFPGETGTKPGGLPFRWAAEREGGARNGVRTAIEDFVKARPGLRLAAVPAFFGFGVVWPGDAAWAAKMAEFLDPWDGNPVLDLLESNRVYHLATVHMRMVEAGWWRSEAQRKDAVLRRLLQSKAFAIAERLSKLRHRGEPEISRDEVRRALEVQKD